MLQPVARKIQFQNDAVVDMYWFSGKRSIAAFAKLVPSDLLSPFDGFFLKRCGKGKEGVALFEHNLFY